MHFFGLFKKRTLWHIGVLVACCYGVPFAENSIAVKAFGFSNKQGVARFELYSKSQDFLKHPKAQFSKTASISADTTAVVFVGVPFGEYALLVFHDQNANGVLDKNFIGMPTEGCGFSTPTKPKGPVAYNDAKFVFAEKLRTLVIPLYYIFKK